MKNEYDLQAEKFLKKVNTFIDIKESNFQEKPEWAKGRVSGIKYDVQIKNNKGEYIFPFWDSVYNKEKGKKPTRYDILACLGLYYPENFEDFCIEFGYDIDSRKAEKIHQECLKEKRGLENIFTAEEIEELQEIN